MTWQNPVALLAVSLHPAQTQIVFRHITPPKKERQSQGGAGASSPSLSVRISSQHDCRNVEEGHRLLFGGGRVHSGGWLRRMSCWTKRRTSWRQRIICNYMGVRKHWFKTIDRDRIHLLTNLEAEELAPPL